MPGMRHRDTRNGMAQPGVRPKLLRLTQVLARPGWLWDVALRGKPLLFGNLQRQLPNARDLDAFRAFIDAQFDPGVTWAELDWLRARWPAESSAIVRWVKPANPTAASASCACARSTGPAPRQAPNYDHSPSITTSSTRTGKLRSTSACCGR